MASFSQNLNAPLNGEHPKKIAIAVSGGRDSLALTHMAQAWAKKNKITLIALTVDHQLRKESATECQKLNEWMTENNIEHYILEWTDVKPKTAIQEKARDARYTLLTEKCRELGINHLLLGHTRDDLAETFLMRLNKGSGLNGLSSIQGKSQRNGITILRPMLETSRAETTEYCVTNNLPYQDDPSNENDNFERIQWRNIITKLDDAGGFMNGVALSAKRIKRAADALDYYADFAYDISVVVRPEGYAIVNLSKLHTYPDATGIRVLRAIINQIGGDTKTIENRASDALYDSLMDTGFKGQSVGGCVIRPRDNHPERTIEIIRENRHLPKASPLKGEQTAWDKRFIINHSFDHAGAQIDVLNEKRAQTIFDILPKSRRTLPQGVMETLPAVIIDDKVIAVPHLGFFDTAYGIDFDHIHVTLQFTV